MSSTATPQPARQLTSDTYAGISPEALRALEEANRGHAPAYGDDPWTARAAERLRELFETDCAVYFERLRQSSLAIVFLSRFPHQSCIYYEQVASRIVLQQLNGSPNHI